MERFTDWLTTTFTTAHNYPTKVMTEFRLIDVDIQGVEVIYLPVFYHREWKHGFHEFVSEVPSESGKLFLLVKKYGVFQRDMDTGLIYKKSEDQKELYFRSSYTAESHVYNRRTFFMLQKPADVRIEFYEDLRKTHFFTEDDDKREKENRRTMGKRVMAEASHLIEENKDGSLTYKGNFHDIVLEFVLVDWSDCKGSPTTMTYLPGMQSSGVFPNGFDLGESNPGAFASDDDDNLANPEIVRRRELFYQSVREHNMRIIQQQQ